MISIKMAFRSVFRRPRQNLSVLMGITLGVALIAGVQIGGDSLGEGFVQFGIHGLGETDAIISSPYSPFFVSEEIINESLGYGPPASSVLELLQQSDGLSTYIESMSQRLELSVSAIEEDTGSTEISKAFIGMDPKEDNPDSGQWFGELANKDGTELKVGDLEPGEVFLGAETAELLFVDVNPINKNITISTTLFSFADPRIGINESIPITIQLNVRIVGIFEDQGKGRENYADSIVTNLPWLQSVVSSTFVIANSSSPIPVYGFGVKPISHIIVKWKDGIDTEAGTAALEKAFAEVVGTIQINLIPFPLVLLYEVSDIRQEIRDSMEDLSGLITDMLLIFGSIIIFAGILVIINIQNMALAAREKETGIVRAIGSKRRQIIISNLTEAMLLGIFGSLLGLLVGRGYGWLLVFFMGWAFDFPSGDIPIIVTQSTLIWAFAAGFIISQITGVLPSINASRINVAAVLRGLTPPSGEKFGRKSLIFGLIFTVIAIFYILTLDPNALVDGKAAFKDVADAESNFLAISTLVLGPSLLFSYYRSKRIGLTFFSLFSLGWANFNIFYVLDLVETGSGGVFWVLGLIFSLVFGSIILVGMNLNYVAAFGQKIASVLAGKRKTPLRGTTLVAFRKMTSKVTRSTLTFALFASILTLNIFLATWSYSFRYGYDAIVVEVSGGTDIMLFSDSPIPDSINFTQELAEEFDELKFVKGFTMIEEPIDGYLSPSEFNEEIEEWPTYLLTMKNGTFEDGSDEFQIKFNLVDDKNGTLKPNGETLETYEDKDDDPAFTAEDQAAWEALLNNETLMSLDGEEKPIIITTFIFQGDVTGFEQTHKPGESVLLNLTDGTVQEFVVGATAGSNPLVEFTIISAMGPAIGSVWFVNDYWASRIDSFQGLQGHSNMFLGKTTHNDIQADEIEDLITDIEIWANQGTGNFRNENGFYGIVGLSVWSIYEYQLDGQYRFFTFLQAFVSLGFIVGVFGLLVVASRSVAERQREIGMLRALGFRRKDVIISVVLELVVMSLIGLVIGFINGSIMGYALTSVNSGGDAVFLIPWGLMIFYSALTVFSAIIAAIFPAIQASRIPPSDALRYTG
ncbi:MAG: ABC transporter permease [Candidatus Kariarchaeaceae archaeon]